MIEKNTLQYCGILPFRLDVNYVEIDSVSHLNINDSHIHEECEIYINLSGDVSFVVEDRLYPIKPGDIIITRPGEFHHCIYRSNALHKHFWILLSASGNESLLDIFFNRPAGSGNIISPSPENSRRINMICNSMLDENSAESERYRLFFDLLSLLRFSAETPDSVDYSVKSILPPDVAFALDFLRNDFSSEVTVSVLAERAHVSVNTLERHFKDALNTTPTEYVRRKRLAAAQAFLRQGYSVQEACESSGFSDYSYFIATFKKTFGVTPLKYKRQFAR